MVRLEILVAKINPLFIMKTLILPILGVVRTNDGGLAIQTKATSFNKDKTNDKIAYHKLTQGQAERMANLTIGSKSVGSLFAPCTLR